MPDQNKPKPILTPMKSILLTATLAAASLALPFSASAGTCPPSQTTVVVVRKYVPIHVCTKVIAARTECRWATDSCGRRYSYEVKIVTYADVYSDGSARTYARTIRL